MGRITSAAGDVTFDMKSIRTDTNGFVIIGRMGVWDAKVHLSYKEMLGGFGNPKTLVAVLRIPILLLKGLFGQKQK